MTTAFLVGAGFIPAIPTGGVNFVPAKSYALEKPIISHQTLQNSAQGIYLLEGYTWHSDCESQLGVVKQATDAMGMGSNWYYMQYIFSNESCVDPGRVNSIGAKGLGQSLNHISFTCSPGDIPCQLNWFNTYAIQRYGSWQNAYNFWSQNHVW